MLLNVHLLDCMVILVSIVWGTSMLFSVVAAPVYLSTNSTQGFPFLHTLVDTCYLVFCCCCCFWLTVILTGVEWIVCEVTFVQWMYENNGGSQGISEESISSREYSKYSGQCFLSLVIWKYDYKSIKHQ